MINYLLCSPVGIDAKKYNRGEGLARLYSNGSKFVCKCIDYEFFKMQSTILTTLETGYNVAICQLYKRAIVLLRAILGL